MHRICDRETATTAAHRRMQPQQQRLFPPFIQALAGWISAAILGVEPSSHPLGLPNMGQAQARAAAQAVAQADMSNDEDTLRQNIGLLQERKEALELEIKAIDDKLTDVDARMVMLAGELSGATAS